MKFVLDMLRVATTMTNGKAEITLRRRRTVSIWEMVRWWRGRVGSGRAGVPSHGRGCSPCSSIELCRSRRRHRQGCHWSRSTGDRWSWFRVVSKRSLTLQIGTTSGVPVVTRSASRGGDEGGGRVTNPKRQKLSSQSIAFFLLRRGRRQ
jgi:hypothetical protein